jgi:hypothetical protein
MMLKQRQEENTEQAFTFPADPKREAQAEILRVLELRRQQLAQPVVSAELETLLPVLKNLARRERRRRALRVAFENIFSFGLFWYWFHYSLHGYGPVSWILFLPFSAVLTLFANALVHPLIAKWTHLRRDAKAIHTVAELDDIRSVGPLAEALELRNAGIQRIAEAALIRLLPRLRASDAGLLSAEQRSYLYRALNGKNEELILAILQALEQVGEGAAFPFVKRLAEGKGRAESSIRVLKTAQECLPFLWQKAANERASNELLRAGGRPDTPADILLRPAAGVADSAQDLLLRASGSDSDSRA